MKTTTNGAARLGIIKTRSGHYAVWCSVGTFSINKLERREATEIHASLKSQMDGKTRDECIVIFWNAYKAH